MKYILPLLFLTLLVGCNKDREDFSDHPELVGDYDWTYTQLSSTQLMTKENGGTPHGLRFFKNGKVFAFKEGKLFKKGIVEDIRQESNGQVVVQVKLKELNSMDFVYANNQLTARKFPYGDINILSPDMVVNVFQKK